MQEINSLEQMALPGDNKFLKVIHYLFLAVECCLVGSVFYFQQQPLAASPLTFLADFGSHSILACLYAVGPMLLFGCKGWKQAIGTFGVGLSLAFTVMSFLFHRQRWMDTEVTGFMGFFIASLMSVLLIIFLIREPNNWSNSTFYKHAALRLPIVLYLSAGLF